MQLDSISEILTYLKYQADEGGCIDEAREFLMNKLYECGADGVYHET